MTTPAPGVIGGAVAIVAIIGATVAVCLGQIDGAAYASLVSAVAGVGIGAGAHASGVAQNKR